MNLDTIIIVITFVVIGIIYIWDIMRGGKQ